MESVAEEFGENVLIVDQDQEHGQENEQSIG